MSEKSKTIYCDYLVQSAGEALLRGRVMSDQLRELLSRSLNQPLPVEERDVITSKLRIAEEMFMQLDRLEDGWLGRQVPQSFTPPGE